MVQTQRIHGLDLLRGIAMMLGIVLHGAIAYKAGYPYGELIHDPHAEFYFFDWLHFFINSFRMQLFFALAGFFTMLLIKKIGLVPFIRNRFMRIAIPLGIAYFTILPATLMPVVYYRHLTDQPWEHVMEFLTNFFLLKEFSGLIHLWFLYDLILFYGLTVGILLVTRWTAKPQGSVQVTGKSTLIFLGTVLVCGLLSQLYDGPVLTIWTGLITPISQLLYYGFFFLVGCLVESHRDVLTQLGKRFRFFLVTGALLSLVNAYVLNTYLRGTEHTLLDFIFRFSVAIQTVSIVCGLVGVFYTKVVNRSVLGEYLATSAYWVYLIHNPIVLGMQLLLLDSGVPGFLRFAVVMVVAATASYASYHYLVRPTWVGLLLNGKRYPTN